MDCFILRGRTGNEVLQRIHVRDTRFQKDMVHIPHTMAGSWRVLRRAFSATEKPIAQRFRHSLRYSALVLENTEHPGVFHRIVNLFTIPQPRRGGLEIPRGCVLEGGALRELNQFMENGTTAWLPLEERPERAREASVSYQFTHSISLGRSLFRNDIPPSLSTIATIPALPTIRPSPPPPSVQALKPFVARILAEAARSKGDDCPITLDTMSTCGKLYVPTCGHVCSDEGCMRLATCPVCRERTAWTTVEFA